MSELESSRNGDTANGGTARAERRARAAADLVLGAELLPGPVPLPDFAAMMAGRDRWRRRGWALGAVGSIGGLALVATLLLWERAPISYVVDGTVAIADGVIDAAGAPGGASASVRFSEGTEVGLAPGARLRVVGRTARGAELALDRGRARFSVTHRSGARWSVATGPFTVDVVGTRFSLDWSPGDERLVVDLTSGSVLVRGASVGGPVAMHPGERLIATAADRRVTLSPLVETEPAPAPGEAVNVVDDGLGNVGQRSATAVAVAPPSVRSTRRGSQRSRLALATPARSYVGQPASTSASSSSGSASARPSSAPSAPSLASPQQQAPSHRPAPTLAPPRAELQPPRQAPQAATSFTLGSGGPACSRQNAQYRFERPESGISLPDYYTLAFSSPRPDRTHSWCGEGSLRLDANFNDSGRRNFFGRFPKETGQVVLKLPRATDFTGKTVTVHFFVDGPADARFTAELVVVNRGRWVSGPPTGQLTAGRWWTISHRFEAENEAGVPGSSNPGPFPVGGTSSVSNCDRLGLAIHSTGGRRVWTGSVYIDDVGWR